jgi:site-specific recombinase XerD
MQAATEQATNRLLKDAAMVAQLDRPVRQVYYVGNDRREDEQLTFEAITTHWARRTFVVHALRLGIPAEVVMRFTGHSGYSAMRPYIAIADELKAEAMQRFDDA